MIPKFSIITVTYNSAEYVSRCISSVLSQNYKNFEYIVIDGCSTDNTIELVKNFTDSRIRIISEPDDGIYDAMNKGLLNSKGEYICILNSDDLLANRYVLTTLNKHFSLGNDILIGDINFFKFGDVNRITRTWRVKEFKLDDFKRGWHPPHPGFFFRRTLFDDFGGFDPNLAISADFEIMLRYLKASDRVKVLGELTTLQQDDGTSSKFRNIITGNKNVLLALKRHGINVNSTRYLIQRLLPKIISRLQNKIIV